jgi:hypothetical protein
MLFMYAKNERQTQNSPFCGRFKAKMLENARQY